MNQKRNMRQPASQLKGVPSVADQRLVRGTSYQRRIKGREGTSRYSLKRLQMICVEMARAPHGITARQLAARGEMEVNPKTIYRDIEILRRLGVAIDSQYEGWPISGYALHNCKCPFCNHETLNTIKTSAPNAAAEARRTGGVDCK